MNTPFLQNDMLIGGLTPACVGLSPGSAGSVARSDGTNWKSNPEIRVYKLSDNAAINNSTVMVADADLLFTILANEIWRFEIDIFWTSATANLKMDLTGPSAPTLIQYGQTGFGPTNPSAFCSAFSPSSPLNQYNGTTSNSTKIFGLCKNGANAGTITFRAAQLAGVAENTVIKAGCSLVAQRLSPV